MPDDTIVLLFTVVTDALVDDDCAAVELAAVVVTVDETVVDDVFCEVVVAGVVPLVFDSVGLFTFTDVPLTFTISVTSFDVPSEARTLNVLNSEKFTSIFSPGTASSGIVKLTLATAPLFIALSP